MSRTMLLVGKEMPIAKEFADAAAKTRSVVLTSPQGENSSKKIISDQQCSFAWNRSSPISAHALTLQCETEFDHLDEAVLYYDETVFAGAYPTYTEQSCSEILHELIAGYQFLTFELLNRFEIKKAGHKPATLVFICKSESKNASYAHTNPCVRAATSAFTGFVQAIAAQYSERDSVNIVLVHADLANEVAHNDTSLATWLCSYMDAVENLKNKLSVRQSCVWVKPGTRSPVGWFH